MIFGALQSSYFLAIFSSSPPPPPHAKYQKMADFGGFAKSLVTRLCEHFWRRGLRQKIFRFLHFKCILDRRSPDWRQRYFRGPEFDLLFRQFSLGTPLQNLRKWPILVFFAKSLITRLCQHFWRRGLRQKVLRSLHFKTMLIKRSPDRRQRDFRGPEVELPFWQFSLGPLFAKSQKMADFGVFAKSLITRPREHFWRCSLRQKVFRSLRVKRILIKRSPDWRQGDYRGPEVELLFGNFPFVPPCKISENGQFWWFCKISNKSALPALLEARFAPESSPILAL